MACLATARLGTAAHYHGIVVDKRTPTTAQVFVVVLALGKVVSHMAVVTCPAGASGTPCACSQGYSGTLTWSTSSQSYSGTCAGLKYFCGYFILSHSHTCIQINVHTYSRAHTPCSLICAVVSCPAGTIGLPCNCTVGYSGLITWTSGSQSYSGTCSRMFFFAF